MNIQSKKSLIWGACFILLAIILGAFAAHALEKILTEPQLKTFKTAVTYQMYQGFGLMILGILQLFKLDSGFKVSRYLILSCTFLFSGNCYLYVLTGVKFFALIVPIGGILMISAWTMILATIIRLKD